MTLSGVVVFKKPPTWSAVVYYNREIMINEQPATNQELLEEIFILKQRIKETDKLEAENMRLKEVQQENERKISALFYEAFHYIAIMAPDGILLEVNRSWLHFSGVKEVEYLDKPLWKMPCWTHSVELQTKLHAAVISAANGEVVHLDVTYTATGGRLCCVDFARKPMKDEHGEILFLIAEGRDITKRKQAEIELRQFKTISDEARYGVLILDLDKNVTYSNAAYAEMHGYTPDKIIGKPLSFSHTEQQIDKVNKLIDRLKQIDLFTAEEIFRKRKDNSEFPVFLTGTLIKDATGTPLFIAFMVIDITEQKQAEKALSENQALYRNLFYSAPMGMMQTSPEGRFLRCNKAFSTLLGYESTEEMLETITDTATQVYADPNSQKKMMDALKRSQSWYYAELPYLRKDGSIMIGKLAIRKVLHPDGTISYYEGILQDVTEQRIAEEMVKKKESELEAKNLYLEELNTALKVLLQRVEKDRNDLDENVLTNVKQFIMPYVLNLKKFKLDYEAKTFVNLIESNLKDITSAFSKKLSSKYYNLTPKELEIANLIKEGKTTKEISEILYVSPGTINVHRDKIRRKLNVKNNKINLRSYLLNLP